DEYLVSGVADGKRRGNLPRNGHNLLEGSVSASGGPGLLATVHADQSIRLASLATGAELVTLTPPVQQTVSGLRFDALGHRLAVATSQHEIHFWDLAELRRGLAELHLDWTDPATNSLAASTAPWPVPVPDTSVLLASGLSPAINLGRPMTLTLLGIFGAALAVFCALLILRRHRRLAEEFVQADAVAMQREHELRAERELNRLKSSFISTVSHEFRTP